MSSEPTASSRRLLVLDANILVRAVLGRRVLSLLEIYNDRVHFLAPEIAYASERAYLPQIRMKRGLAPQSVAQLVEQGILGRLPMIVTPVPHDVYGDFEREARQRLARRDESDWPFVALALRLSCPIWTEDQDFFGSGVATWTTDRVEIFLASDR